MTEALTPMMKQYMDIKMQYKDCLLFYRMGDFYELFMEDAHIGAQVLNITLTGKAAGKENRIPMAGVPYHAVDIYLAKLVKAGYKVAICEQVSQPNKYGLVKREVVRVVTPGTVLDEKALEKKENNYIISLSVEGNQLAISAADISTGYFATMQTTYIHLDQTIRDELSKLSPSECILSEELYNNPDILTILNNERGLNIYCFHNWNIFSKKAETFLKDHFSVKTLAGFAIEDKTLALQTSAALLGYLKTTQKDAVNHIRKISHLSTDQFVLLDKSTMINLELFSTIREHDTKGALLTILDQTITAMGGRLMKQWLKKPLNQQKEILMRHDAVDWLLTQRMFRKTVRDLLEEVADIERLLSRLSVRIGNPRDVTNVKLSLETVLKIKEVLNQESTPLLKEIFSTIPSDIQMLVSHIENYIVDEPPIDIRSGGIIKPEISEELDHLREIVGGSKKWITTLEKEERERTGINSLKIRFNKVFGFYIEISKSNLHLIPENYIRKQTLVNGERFITSELKEHEEIILTADEKINIIEYDMFMRVLDTIATYTKHIQDSAEAIGTLDCVVSFAQLAEKENYVRPTLVTSGEIKITKGRHPVVEKLLEEIQFVPNDVCLDNSNQQLLVITGPNMAGKSVFIRQTALLVLMNQLGSFVPAESAELSIVDRIFVRSGASDVITSGLSTFMVEMVETAHILHHATKQSLIVMDEIGRGTSTYDGISIAWAVAEYLVTHEHITPKTLFATHYHELQALEEKYPTKIKNYHMAVEEMHGEPIFLHTILPGGASHSFGVAVAKLAGVPESVIEKAMKILHSLEQRDIKVEEPKGLKKKYETKNSSIINELKTLTIHEMTPLQALNKLAELKNMVN